MRDSEMDRGMIFLKEFHILHHLFLQEAYKEGQPLGGEEFERFIERLRGTLGTGVQLPPTSSSLFPCNCPTPLVMQTAFHCAGSKFMKSYCLHKIGLYLHHQKCASKNPGVSVPRFCEWTAWKGLL